MKHLHLLLALLLLNSIILGQDSNFKYIDFDAQIQNKISESTETIALQANSMIAQNGEQYIEGFEEYDTTTNFNPLVLKSILSKYSINNFRNIYWDHLSNTRKFYDTQGRVDYILFPAWDGKNWDNNYKTDYTYYDTDNKYDEFITYLWAGTWVNSSKTQITYNSSGSRLTEIVYNWDANVWVNSYAVTYKYSNTNKLIEYYIQKWDGTFWNDSYRYLYSYDSDNKLISNTYQIWVNGKWNNNYRYLTSYNAKGAKTKYKYQEWGGNGWLNVFKPK
jgi:hypothetical protein